MDIVLIFQNGATALKTALTNLMNRIVSLLPWMSILTTKIYLQVWKTRLGNWK